MEIYKDGCGVALIRHSKDNRIEILLGKRSDGQGWCMAGGKIEPGEHSKEAALRELKEEFGIILDPEKTNYLGNFFGSAIIKKQKKMAISTIYYYKLQPGEELIQLDERTTEMETLRWFNLQDILTCDNLFPITTTILAKIFCDELEQYKQ